MHGNNKCVVTTITIKDELLFGNSCNHECDRKIPFVMQVRSHKPADEKKGE